MYYYLNAHFQGQKVNVAFLKSLGESKGKLVIRKFIRLRQHQVYFTEVKLG